MGAYVNLINQKCNEYRAEINAMKGNETRSISYIGYLISICTDTKIRVAYFDRHPSGVDPADITILKQYEKVPAVKLSESEMATYKAAWYRVKGAFESIMMNHPASLKEFAHEIKRGVYNSADKD